MTDPKIIRQKRDQNLEDLGEILSSLDGVTETHLETMRNSATGQGRSVRNTPTPRDDLGNHAYNAAVFLALAESVARLQERVEELEGQLTAATAASK